MSKPDRREEIIYVDEDGNPIDPGEDEEYEYEYVEEVVEAGPGGLSLALNKVFHFLDRGGSLGGEIGAGILMGLLAVCVVFMNMQVLGNLLTADAVLSNTPMNAVNIAAATTYTELYAASLIVSILGTIAIGVAANLPLVQLSAMGLAGALLCYVETGTGLTVENLLFVNLIAGGVYAVLVLVPGVRTLVGKAVPKAVRKGLPVALGLMLAWMAIRLSGLVEASDITIMGAKTVAGVSGVDISTSGLGLATLIGIAVALVTYIALRVVGKGHPVILALLGGTVVYMVYGLVTGGTDTASSGSIANFGRVWLVAGSQASETTPFADSYLTYAMTSITGAFSGLVNVVSEGSDFSAYSGNIVMLVVSGVLFYFLSALLQVEGTVEAVVVEAGITDDAEAETALGRARAANALVAVVGPFLGVGAVVTSKVSVAGAQDKAKSGLASIVAAIVLAISLGVMIFPALFATKVYPVSSMNEWNYFAYGNGGIVYLIRNVAFGIADVVMAVVGLSMAARLTKLSGVRELVPAVVCAIAAVATLNIVVGVAAGLLVYLALAIPAMKDDSSALGIPMVVLEALLIATVVLL